MPVFQRRVWVVVLVLALVTSPALANSGTLLIWAGMLHLWVGNLFIGLLESFIISRRFPAQYDTLKVWVVSANYCSVLVGYVALLWLQGVIGPFTLGSEPLYHLTRHMAVMFVAAFLLSVLVEWPFVHGAFRRERRAILAETQPDDGAAPLPVPEVDTAFTARQSFKATLLANTISYLLLIPFYWLPSGTGLLTQVHVTRSLAFVKHPEATVFYEAFDGPQVYRMKLDGTEKAPVSDKEIPEEFYNYTDRSGRVKYDLRLESDRTWDVYQDFWGTEGIRATDTRTGASFSTGLETPLIRWVARSANILPGDQVLFQLGGAFGARPETAQIVILDLNTRQMALLARGTRPVVVLEKHGAEKRY